ncbi:type I polyketide synthase [Shewanella violacea]|uniref:Omega-3 polyunsaturated fatty acid synthase PfaA n=1 Tax=Shewanella violacea (strain JCM 10179 / CIP 106290 / LMG 19151 / DSS12) TaxID=637905 RepID=D4ZHM4_SHEVD|nr:type I polyketide synthase [Shewanella violacea]BAJ01173.1 omega-3 polyunsaturated fatty acid synthase PfaA [Shewanella violacea DSS12]
MSQTSKPSKKPLASDKKSAPESVQDLKADKRLNKRLKDMPIAIVGMASIFANSRYLNKFWDLISEKIDAITDMPSTHWQPEDYYDANKSTPDKTYCKRGGFLPDVDFNPMEFGLPPNILELTDTSQLLSLIVAKEVLADANLPEGYDRDKIGITLGVGGGQKISHSLTARLQYPVLKKVFKNSGISDTDSEMLIKKFQDQYIHWEENSFPGSLGNVISGRIANRFDLGGMNCVVDAACAGSLAAMRMAVSELVDGRSDMMITGGVCTDNSPSMYMSFSKTPAFTTNETIQPFDIDSKGMMIGEGIGMIALKRLEDAERDGDRIYSVIKGIGSSSDGKFKSIYAPRPEGQAKALNRAYDDAGFAPHTLGLIEAHGTGTAAGDAAEFAGLCSVFSQGNDTKQHIALGSVKSQIGHTKSTAGTAGLIKASLALHHKVLPATINISEPSPKLDIENSPFYLNTETRPWLPRADGTPRRAGISSFGFGGTNFHFVLEEYTKEHQRNDSEKSKYRQRQVAQSFLVSAASKDALISELNTLAAATANADFILNKAAADYALRKLDTNAPRLGLVANSKEELATLIKQAVAKLTENSDDTWQLPGGTSYRTKGVEGKVAALFAGQGSQYLNMGRDLACYYPEMRQQFVTADKVFAANNKQPLSQTLYPRPVFNKDDLKAQEAILTNTANAQSAIGAISMGQYELFTAAGFSADMVAGHSFGELSALCAAGVISSYDYYQLAFARGDAMATKAEPKKGETEADTGAMFAIITKSAADLEAVEATIAKFDGVKVANYNAPTQSVIAGPTVSTGEAAKALSELGYKAINLPVSGAFHTELVGHAQAPFANAIDAAKFNKPKRALYSNATGELYDTNAGKIKASFKKHMLQSVRFTAELEAMYAAGARVFVEFGPKNILQKLVVGTLTDKALANKSELCTISINPSPKGDSDLQLKQAAVQMAVAGIKLDNIDPYQADIAAPAKASPMNITLNAVNHISKSTRAKMAKSLETGTVTSTTIIEEKIVEKVVEKIVEVEKVIEKVIEVEKIVELVSQQPGNAHLNHISANAEPVQESRVVSKNSKPLVVVNSSDALTHFFAAQQQAAELHQQFLEIPQQYGDTFTTLMTEQTKLASAGIAIPESLQRSMEQFHQLQAQTLLSHTQFLEMQAGSNTAALSMLNGAPAVITTQVPLQTATALSAPVAAQPTPVVAQVTAPVQTPAPVVAAPKPAAIVAPVQAPKATPTISHQAAPVQAAVVPVAPSGLSAAKVQATMLEVVAEKTGYPTEMLELEMDMEADLGIDSIKRVEILGTVQDELPGLPELSPEDLAECRTLGEIVAYMNSKLPSGSSTTQATSAAAALSQTAEGSLSTGLSAQEVQATMMSVVADKTGYPTEMLELEMDMEADLGIDSIKRVEILGTVQDELPGLPELNPEDLAECRTLGEIVAYMNSKLPSTNTSAAPQVSASPVANGLSSEKVQATMMSVVAEKTGYPTEMLELEMDMEADLGIDSIKRVEILGTVQDELPGLPELNPEDLAECRTLGEIVAYMNSKLPSTNTSAAPQVSASPVANGLSSEKVQATMMSVVADKTGYPTEMLELSMDMEADLGIDSIKRVEILGTVQDELPGLPELNPEDLAECRTLGEIVTYMNSKLPAANSAAAAPQAVAATSELSAETALSAQEVQATMMSVVADKTGYPTEMLELSMDMEADLGIDSIKRVEILGTVQDELPGLPELNPEDLAECRTLGEIVAYMNSQLAEGSKLPAEGAAPQAVVATSELSAETALSAQVVQSTMMSVVADKTGYPTEMLELSMDMEADLGIDSIKRVEILGTVQDELPSLPELNPEDLAECKTLGEIVAYMNSKLANTGAVSTKPAPVSAQPTEELPPHSEVALKKLNAADTIKDCFAADASLVITDDGHNAGVLAEKLTKQGLKVAVIRLAKGGAQSPLNSDVASFQAKSTDEAGIRAVIGQIEQQLGKIGGFIHLQPEANSKNKTDAVNLNSESFTHVSQAFLWAKLLQPTLTASSDKRRSFITVSRIDGGFGYLDTQALKDAELNQAALAGLTKTLSHEWPTVFCRALDVASNLDATHLADAITNELFDSVTNLAEVGLSLDKKGNVTRATLVAGDAADKTAKCELNSADTILVTGGAKGVTFECALALAKRTQSHFILAGRSELQAIPQWAENKQISELKPAAIAHIISTGQKPTPKQVESLVWTVKSSMEINTALEAFAQVGASAEYVSMDVTDTAAINKALTGKANAITGLIHGAGVLADKHIEDKTIEELGRVYGTKVNGLKAVLSVLDASKIKLLAMFSSAAGFYGNTGQSDYAMSNDILNKAALQFTGRNPQAKVMSFNWGPWDGGMVNPALKKMFTDRGVYVIPLKAGAELFATQLLSETGVQLLVGTSMQGGGDSQSKIADGSATEGSSVKKLNAGEVQLAQHPQRLATKGPLTPLTLTRTLNPNAMVFIQDHRISGNPVLPTVCAIAWMREAASEMLGSRVKVLDYKLLKGIIFDNDDVQEIKLELTPIEALNQEPSTALGNSEPSAALKMSAMITCQGRPQYKATLVSDESIELPQAKRFTDTGECIATASELYSNGTLFHGPRLQGIEKVFQFDDSGLLASCRLPHVSDEDCGHFVATTHLGGSQPFAEDLLLQAMLVWARLKYGAASLPSAIGEFISNKPMAFGESGIIELEVIKTNSRSLLANVALYHENGELSAMMKGAKVTVSKSLNNAFLAEPSAALDKENEAK